MPLDHSKPHFLFKRIETGSITGSTINSSTGTITTRALPRIPLQSSKSSNRINRITLLCTIKNLSTFLKSPAAVYLLRRTGTCIRRTLWVPTRISSWILCSWSRRLTITTSTRRSMSWSRWTRLPFRRNFNKTSPWAMQPVSQSQTLTEASEVEMVLYTIGLLCWVRVASSIRCTLSQSDTGSYRVTKSIDQPLADHYQSIN